MTHNEAETLDLPAPEEIVGEEVRHLRKARGWSQEELARRMVGAGFGTWHQSTVGRTETADRPLRLNEAVALAELFGTSLTGLMEPIRMSLEEIDEEITKVAAAHNQATHDLTVAEATAHEAEQVAQSLREHRQYLLRQQGATAGRLGSLRHMRRILTGEESR